MAHKVPHDSHLAPIIYHLNYMIFSVRFRAEKEGGGESECAAGGGVYDGRENIQHFN